MNILVFIIEQEYEWSDLQKMAFSYARRALVVGMYLQGLVPLDMYEQANGSFKSMQLQTGQTKEFQIEASSQSTDFLSLYYKDIDKDFIKTMFNLVINDIGNDLSNGEYYTFEGVIEYIRQKHELQESLKIASHELKTESQELLRMASQINDASDFMQSLIAENATCDDDKILEKKSLKDKENKTEKNWIADIQFEVFLPNEYQIKMYDAVRGIKSASDSTMSNPSLENIEMLQNNIKYGINMGNTIENWLLHKNIQVPKSEHILTAFYLVNLGDVTSKDAENFSDLEIKNTFITSLSGLGQTNLSPDDIPTESVEIIRVAVSWLLAHPVH